MENIMKMLVTVNKSMIKIQQTLDEVVNENKKLRFEIAQLKEEKLQKIESKTKTFATAVLQIKPKNKGEEVKKMKDQIRNRINPAELGVGLLIGKTTKNGDLILTCKNEEKDMREIQHKIQEDMGQNYEVSEKRLHKNRIKIVGIHEQENSEKDKTLIEKIINQNELDRQRAEVEIIYRSKISNKRFSIILESNELVYKRLIAGEVYIGWSRCKAYEEFGVFRCYKQWRLVRGGRVGSAHPKPNDIFFLNLCILIFKFTNYLIDDLLLESKCFYRYIKTFPRRIFVRVDMSSLRGVR
jgi:hypothetical protein